MTKHSHVMCTVTCWAKSGALLAMQGSDARDAVISTQPHDARAGPMSPAPSKRLRLGQPDGNDALLAPPNASLLSGTSTLMSPAGQVPSLIEHIQFNAFHCKFRS